MKRKPRSKYTKEVLEPLVAKTFSVQGILRELRLRPTVGNHWHIKNLIQLHEISTSHWTGAGHMRGKKSVNRLAPSKILVEDLEFTLRPGRLITRALLEIGRKHVCASCGLTNLWNDKKLVLEIHHKNGKRWDNRENNVDFLCPNCHSQTSNSGKLNLPLNT